MALVLLGLVEIALDRERVACQSHDRDRGRHARHPGCGMPGPGTASDVQRENSGIGKAGGRGRPGRHRGLDRPWFCRRPDGSPRLEVRLHGREDGAAQPGRRLERLRSDGQIGQDATEFGKLRVRLAAPLHVVAHLGHLVELERSQHEAGGKLTDAIASNGHVRPGLSCRSKKPHPPRRVP